MIQNNEEAVALLRDISRDLRNIGYLIYASELREVSSYLKRQSGEIGRRKGLKIPGRARREGSNPSSGTIACWTNTYCPICEFPWQIVRGKKLCTSCGSYLIEQGEE